MQGNVVLTDASYKVLAAQRAYKDDNRGWAVSPGLLYPVSMIRLYENLDAPALEAALAAAEPKFTLKSAPSTPTLAAAATCHMPMWLLSAANPRSRMCGGMDIWFWLLCAWRSGTWWL